MDVSLIFPTAIAIEDLSHAITDEHKKHIAVMEYTKNEGNHTSREGYILNWPVFSDLKQIVENKINDYFNNYYAPIDDVNLKITQSWLNVTTQNEFHHQHSHPNSAFSAVLYLKVSEDDVIKFHKPNHSNLKFETKEWNLINSESWIVPVKLNHLIIFPSWLEHSVPVKTTEGQRVSMAINTFYNGKLGDEKSSTALRIQI